MIEERVQYARDNFFVDGFFAENAVRYELEEPAQSGQAQLILSVRTKDNLCVENYDAKEKCEYLNNESGLKKAVDHFVLVKQEDYWELHLIEIKKTVGHKTWNRIKDQLRASYLNIKALAAFLNIDLKDKNICAYTAYGTERLQELDKTNPRAILPNLGERAIDEKADEWDSGCVYVPIIKEPQKRTLVKLKHVPVKLNCSDENSRLEGTLTI